MTRRQLTMAFWASVRIWVPIWTGPTNSVTRNANASTLPAVMSEVKPSSTPTISTPALARPAEMPPSENDTTVNFCARVLAVLNSSMAASMRPWVRSSTAYERTVAAPTTGSEMAPSSTPTWWRTTP